MSLVVKNAYRYPLHAQRVVHEALRTNAEAVTRELVDAAVASMSKEMPARRADRLSYAKGYMVPTMPKSRVSDWTTRVAESDDDGEHFLRAYLLDYHRFVQSDVKTWPFIDTVMSWTYTWDTEHGYVVLHLPLGVSSEQMTSGLDAHVEPFSYDGRTGETNSATVGAADVAAAWDRLVGMNSIGYVGATARLEGYELRQTFGLP